MEAMEAIPASTHIRKTSVAEGKANSSRTFLILHPHHSSIAKITFPLRGHCLGDDTVQCCVDGPMDFSYEDSPGWRNNSPEDNSVIVPTLPNIGGEDSVIVPTLPTIDGEDAIVFPPIPTVNSEDGSIVVPTIPTANSEDDGIVVPTFNSPQTPPTTNPGGNWHKGGWANDIASAYSPTTEDYEYGSYDGDSGEWIV